MSSGLVATSRGWLGRCHDVGGSLRWPRRIAGSPVGSSSSIGASFAISSGLGTVPDGLVVGGDVTIEELGTDRRFGRWRPSFPVCPGLATSRWPLLDEFLPLGPCRSSRTGPGCFSTGGGETYPTATVSSSSNVNVTTSSALEDLELIPVTLGDRGPTASPSKSNTPLSAETGTPTGPTSSWQGIVLSRKRTSPSPFSSGVHPRVDDGGRVESRHPDGRAQSRN